VTMPIRLQRLGGKATSMASILVRPGVCALGPSPVALPYLRFDSPLSGEVK